MVMLRFLNLQQGAACALGWDRVHRYSDLISVRGPGASVMRPAGQLVRSAGMRLGQRGESPVRGNAVSFSEAELSSQGSQVRPSPTCAAPGRCAALAPIHTRLGSSGCTVTMINLTWGHANPRNPGITNSAMEPEVQTSFYGRFRHFLDIIDPRTLFVTEKRLREAVQLLEDYKHGTLRPGVTNEQLWSAQKIKQAILHPDTNEKIFMPFRMSGYIPFGTPIVVGLLLPNQTLASTVFWQWLNQSHNACVNYANRNATKPSPASKFIQGYLGAVISAVSIAVGLNVLVQKANKFTPATRLLVQRFVPFPAVASANICNVVLMRYGELEEGIDVLDADGNLVGSSKIAARHALLETALTRVVLPMPILVLPPIVMSMLEKTALLQARPRLLLPVHSLVCLAAFGLALPLAISLFPQMSEMEKLRPQG